MNRNVYSALANVAAIVASGTPNESRGLPAYMTEQTHAGAIAYKSARRFRSRNTHRGKRGKRVTL